MGRAIVRQPKVFLFDEPLSNLDALLRSEMRTEIKKLHQRIGATTIYVTHDQVEAMTLAERIVVLSGGNIMQVGTPDEIYNRPASKFVAGFTGSPPMNFLKAGVALVDGKACVALGNSAQQLVLPTQQAYYQTLAGRAVTFGIRPEDIRLEQAGPNDVKLVANVVVLEPLGAETLVTLACEGGELIARLPPNLPFVAGAQTSVWVNMDKCHLFDQDTQLVLRAA